MRVRTGAYGVVVAFFALWAFLAAGSDRVWGAGGAPGTAGTGDTGDAADARDAGATRGVGKSGEAAAPKAQAKPIDTLVLGNGKTLRGTLLDFYLDEYVVQVGEKKEFLHRARVTDVRRAVDQRLINFIEKKVLHAKDLKEVRKIARFALKKKAYPEYRNCLRTILGRKPDDTAARSGLGQALHEGRWLSESEVQSKLREGYRVEDGRLVAPPAVRAVATRKERRRRAQKMLDAAEDVADFLRIAKEFEEEKDHELALHAYRQALFLRPEVVSLQHMVRKAKSKVARDTGKAAEALLASDKKDSAIRLLKTAFELEPRPSFASQLKKLGYKPHLGRWRTQAEIAAFNEEQEQFLSGVRESLGLDESYRLFTTPNFRVFSNLPEGSKWDQWMAPVLKVIEGALEKYTWVFQGELDMRAATRGMVVVFFKDESSYRSYVESHGPEISFRTAGFYDPSSRSSFFYRDSGYGGIWPTLIHELTHQFNHLLLHGAQPSWINEGVAEFFETAIVSRDYTLTIGRPMHRHIGLFKSEKLTESSRYIPAEKLFRARSVDSLVREGYAVGQVYAQAWTWAYFFFHQDAGHRRIILRCIREEQKAVRDGEWESPEAYIQVLEEIKPLAEWDEDCKKFIDNLDYQGRMKGK